MACYIPRWYRYPPEDGHPSIRARASKFQSFFRPWVQPFCTAHDRNQHSHRRRDYVAERAPAVQKSIDISWRPGPQQQTHRNGELWLNDGTDGHAGGQTDRQTDRRTDARQFHSTKRAASTVGHILCYRAALPPNNTSVTMNTIRYDTIRDAILTCARKPT